MVGRVVGDCVGLWFSTPPEVEVLKLSPPLSSPREFDLCISIQAQHFTTSAFAEKDSFVVPRFAKKTTIPTYELAAVETAVVPHYLYGSLMSGSPYLRLLRPATPGHAPRLKYGHDSNKVEICGIVAAGKNRKNEMKLIF